MKRFFKIEYYGRFWLPCIKIIGIYMDSRENLINIEKITKNVQSWVDKKIY
jgi:hypothetical protein